jgi:hypothetical protein
MAPVSGHCRLRIPFGQPVHPEKIYRLFFPGFFRAIRGLLSDFYLFMPALAHGPGHFRIEPFIVESFIAEEEY